MTVVMTGMTVNDFRSNIRIKESAHFAIDSFQMLKLPQSLHSLHVLHLILVLENQKVVLEVLESPGSSFCSICTNPLFKFPVLGAFYLFVVIN